MNFANLLTIFRLVLVPVFILLFALGLRGWGLSVFCVAGVTDLVDGTVARMFKQTSEKGALIDPLADKLLLGSAFVCLFMSGLIPLWFVIIAIGRDLMIMSGVYYLRLIKAKLLYGATYVSKFATLLQLVTAAFGLLIAWSGERTFLPILRLFCYCTAFFLVVSGVQYVLLGMKLRATAKNKIIP